MFTPVYSICISSSKLSRKIHGVSILKKLFEVPNYARYDSRRCQPVKCQLSLRQLKGFNPSPPMLPRGILLPNTLCGRCCTYINAPFSSYSKEDIEDFASGKWFDIISREENVLWKFANTEVILFVNFSPSLALWILKSGNESSPWKQNNATFKF